MGDNMDMFDDPFGFEPDYLENDHPYEWTDANRKCWSVFEMETEHLIRAARFIRNRSREKSKPPVYYSMLVELARRGAISYPGGTTNLG